MSMWTILDIEATQDQKAIKRAYAKKLKTVRPEEDSEGFMALRQAYDSAIQWCHYRAYEDYEDYEDYEECEDDEEVAVGFEEVQAEPQESQLGVEFTIRVEDETTEDLEYPSNPSSVWSDYQMALDRQLNHSKSRLCLSKWQTLLDHEIFWNLDTRPQAFEMLVEGISDIDKFSRQVLWLLREPVHQLVNDCNHYYHLSALDRIEFIKTWHVQMDRQLLPDSLLLSESMTDELIQTYEEKLIRIRASLSEGETLEAEEQFNQAKRLCDSDPYLWILGSEIFLKRGDKREATASLNQAMTFGKKHEEVHYALFNLSLQYQKPGLRRPVARAIASSPNGGKLQSVIQVREALADHRHLELPALTDTLSLEANDLWHELHLRRLYEETLVSFKKYPKNKELKRLAAYLNTAMPLFVGLEPIPSDNSLHKDKQFSRFILFGLLFVIVVICAILNAFFGVWGVVIGCGVMFYGLYKFGSSS